MIGDVTSYGMYISVYQMSHYITALTQCFSLQRTECFEVTVRFLYPFVKTICVFEINYSHTHELKCCRSFKISEGNFPDLHHAHLVLPHSNTSIMMHGSRAQSYTESEQPERQRMSGTAQQHGTASVSHTHPAASRIKHSSWKRREGTYSFNVTTV